MLENYKTSPDFRVPEMISRWVPDDQIASVLNTWSASAAPTRGDLGEPFSTQNTVVVAVQGKLGPAAAESI